MTLAELDQHCISAGHQAEPSNDTILHAPQRLFGHEGTPGVLAAHMEGTVMTLAELDQTAC